MSHSTISLYQLSKLFPNEEKARSYMESRRWPNGAVCPDCGESKRITTRKNGFYRCNACKTDFTVRTGSIFGRSHIPLDKWILGIYLLMTARKGISSLQLAKEIGIAQSSAWFMLQRLREACGNDPTILSGIVEIDETYIGGKEKNKHNDKKLRAGRGTVGKIPVLGMRERGGRTKARPVSRTDALNLQGEIRRSVEAGSMIHTDEHGSKNFFGAYEIHHADSFAWMAARAENSIHAIVTDPPYGVKEYTEVEKAKLRSGKGGVWRIPPSFDGHQRAPLPRFTVLDEGDIADLRAFFEKFAKQALRVLVPGGHVMIATNPLLSQYVYVPMMEAGFEKRGEIIRLVQTLRGGDRPKNAHEEFHDVSVMPRSAWEPWGLFRKPVEGRVQDNLRKWGTGGLRRVSDHEPFLDVIRSSVARNGEREIINHPSLKPQAFMRQLTRAALPLGKGVILDPFMGSGSTVAAAAAVGYSSIGVEKDSAYFAAASKAIPALARYVPKDASGGMVAAPIRKRPSTSRTKQTRYSSE